MSFLLTTLAHLLYTGSLPQRQGPQKSLPNTDIEEISRSILVDGIERVLSYDGTGQYNRDGTGPSACGLAALNFARIVFSMEQGGLQNTDLLQAVLARECAEVRRFDSVPYPDTFLFPFSKLEGNYCYMHIMAWQRSFRCRRYLPHSLV
jgi:hypothetical protein